MADVELRFSIRKRRNTSASGEGATLMRTHELLERSRDLESTTPICLLRTPQTRNTVLFAVFANCARPRPFGFARNRGRRAKEFPLRGGQKAGAQTPEEKLQISSQSILASILGDQEHIPAPSCLSPGVHLGGVREQRHKQRSKIALKHHHLLDPPSPDVGTAKSAPFCPIQPVPGLATLPNRSALSPTARVPGIPGTTTCDSHPSQDSDTKPT
ncbi:hypothetical protein B0J14DRAFT_557908 [Halenospora varia]|nr:hypothetical protein B0J14DRAFT_557908 [Halenospora varia]